MMADESDIFGAGGIADSTAPLSNNPPNRVSDFNLIRAGLLGQYDGLAGSSLAGVTPSSPGAPMLYRGYLVSTQGMVLNSKGQDAKKQPPKYYFGFHYNPTEINFAYDMNEDTLTPEALGGENAAITNLVGGASVSFQMRLDRTLEMAAISQGPDSPGNLGVLHDMRVLQKLVGGLDSGGSGNSNGQIISVPVNVVFSNQLGNSVAPTEAVLTSTGLNFRGYLTSMQVTFTQFNYLMVPTRAEVDVIIRKVFNPGTTNSADDPAALGDPNTNKPGTQPGFSSGAVGRSYAGNTESGARSNIGGGGTSSF